jgi:hypothetical protein
MLFAMLEDCGAGPFPERGLDEALVTRASVDCHSSLPSGPRLAMVSRICRRPCWP